MFHDGTTLKVPVVHTNLLSGVQHGELVEIDTQVGIYYGAEVVERVRVLERPKSRGAFIKPDPAS